MRKKTFLHICLSESWGGLEMAVSKWNEVLAEQEHASLNICTPDSPLAKDLKAKGYSVLEWNSANYFSPDFTFKLRQLMGNYNIDAVLLQNLRDLWLVSPALFGNKKTKLVGFCQMLVGVKKKDFLHRLIYKRLDHLCVLTDWQQSALMPFLPVEKEKYKTVPNFVDCERFHPNRRSESFRYQLGLKDDQFAIGIIGRIDEQKGQKELVLAFSEIIKKYVNCRLVIVGEPTVGEPEQEKYARELKKLIKELKLESKILFFGFRKDTHLLAANMDLFVLPSYRETFGYVVVEAMASGTPVIGTNAGGVPEILGQGKYGYLCEARSSSSLAEKLEEALAQPDERAEKSKAALARVREVYEKTRVYKKLIETIF
jgi:glycosyltransferase involved in cell wall biosynthesis